MLIDLLMGEVSRIVMLASLLDFRKAVSQNGPASQLSGLAEPYLIELSLFVGISERFRFHLPDCHRDNK